MSVNDPVLTGPRTLKKSELWSAIGRPSAIALVSVLLAWAGTLLLHRIVPDRPLSFVLFFAAVAVSAGLGGLTAGVLATLLSALTCDYFFLAPIHSFTVAASDLPLLLLFIIAAVFINGLSGRLRAQTRQADRRYYQLVQRLDGIVWEANPRTLQYTFVSDRAEMLLGYPISQWLEDPDFRKRIVHPADAERICQLWQTAVQQGGEHSADYRALASTGHEIWIRETLFVGQDAQGRANRMQGLAIDITQRKAEADELERVKDEFALLNKMTAALSASLELEDFAAALRSQIRQQLNVEAGCLYLADDEEEDLRLYDAWGVSPEQASAWRQQAGAPLARLVADAEHSGQRPFAIPLLAKDHLSGALLLLPAGNPALQQHREAFYGTLGRQIGALLQNVSLYKEVREGREQLHQLSRQLVTVQEAERRSIARELHDEIGQALTGLKLTLEMSSRLQVEDAEAALCRALELVQGLIKQVESLSLDLRPAMLDDLGLLPALHWHCKRYTTLTGIQVQLDHSGVGGRFPTEVEITAYRIIQEALTNAARHAKTDRVAVRLWATREILGIQVADSGCGYDPAAAVEAASSGLTGMRERASLLGGHLAVETAPGSGTSITVDLPLVEKPENSV